MYNMSHFPTIYYGKPMQRKFIIILQRSSSVFVLQLSSWLFLLFLKSILIIIYNYTEIHSIYLQYSKNITAAEKIIVMQIKIQLNEF